MIKINKTESIEIRKVFPSTIIAITNRQSSHKGYYVEDTARIRKILDKIRKENVVTVYNGK